MKSRQWLIHHHRLYPGYVWDREREEIKFVAENILNQYKIIPTRMCSPVEGQAIRSFGTDSITIHNIYPSSFLSMAVDCLTRRAIHAKDTAVHLINAAS